MTELPARFPPLLMLLFQLQPKNMIGLMPKSSFLRNSRSRGAKPTVATTIARCLTTTAAASLRSIPTLAELSATSCRWRCYILSLDPWCYDERIPPIFGLYLRKRSSNSDASATIGNVHVLIKISNGASGHERGNRGFTVVASLLVHCEDAIPSCNKKNYQYSLGGGEGRCADAGCHHIRTISTLRTSFCTQL